MPLSAKKTVSRLAIDTPGHGIRISCDGWFLSKASFVVPPAPFLCNLCVMLALPVLLADRQCLALLLGLALFSPARLASLPDTGRVIVTRLLA